MALRKCTQTCTLSSYMYQVVVEQGARAELHRMRAFDRTVVVAALRRQLSTTPAQVGGDIKKLEAREGQPPPFVWQLSVGVWRVFYDVDEEEQVVKVQAVRRKGRSTTGEIT